MPNESRYKPLVTLLAIVLTLFYLASANAAVATYTYDELDRLTKVEYDDGTAIIYAYDEIGNRLQITTNTIAKADFTASTLAGVAPLTINFNDASKGNIIEWLWNFGDGTAASILQNPSHTFNNAGTYTVTLQVSDASGSNSVTKANYITVQPPHTGYVVRIAGKSSYTTLQDAYNAAVTGDVIQAQTQTFTENLNVNRDVSVTIDGGYLPDYTANPGTSNLLGMITISCGTLTIKNIVLQK